MLCFFATMSREVLQVVLPQVTLRVEIMTKAGLAETLHAGNATAGEGSLLIDRVADEILRKQSA